MIFLRYFTVCDIGKKEHEKNDENRYVELNHSLGMKFKTMI